MSCCLPNATGQHRVSLVFSSCLAFNHIVAKTSDHTKEVQCSPDFIKWPHDGFAVAKMNARIQHENEPS